MHRIHRIHRTTPFFSLRLSGFISSLHRCCTTHALQLGVWVACYNADRILGTNLVDDSRNGTLSNVNVTNGDQRTRTMDARVPLFNLTIHLPETALALWHAHYPRHFTSPRLASPRPTVFNSRETEPTVCVCVCVCVCMCGGTIPFFFILRIFSLKSPSFSLARPSPPGSLKRQLQFQLTVG